MVYKGGRKFVHSWCDDSRATAARRWLLALCRLLVEHLEWLALVVQLRHVLALIIDLWQEGLKRIPHIGIGHATRLNKVHIFLLTAEAASLLLRHLSLARVLHHQVQLIAHQHYLNILLGLTHQILQPEAHILKALIVSDIVYNQAAEGLSVMRLRDGPILLGSCCVP